MAVNLQKSVKDQMADVTECSICTEIFTDPKSLPCLHSFCLKCLELYGKDKKAGDQMTCPICRCKFFIPNGGFCSLPSNFFIGKMVDIRKLSSTTISDTLCAICPEEEKVIAKMFCFECEQNLCERCGVSHRKIKLCQNHQVVEIGKKIKEASYRNSYCDQHLGEIVKMYCEDDKATICFLCFAENHQAHKCVSVTKASEELSSVLRNHLEAVKHRLPECKDSFEKLVKLKAGLLTETAEAEQKIVNEATRLKDLVDSHANILFERLTAMRNKKLKEIENAQQDVDRFQTMIASCARYLEELLNKGAPGDICREANQMKTRAEELASLPGICCGCDCCWDNITFKSSNLEDVCFNSTSNIIGNVHSSSSCTQLLSHDKIVYVEDHVGLIPEVVKNPGLR